jgi:hypothetical protein
MKGTGFVERVALSDTIITDFQGGSMMRIPGLILVMALLAGCGSGGGSTTAAGDPGRGLGPASAAGSATVNVSTRASSAETVIYAVDFTILLPAGASVAADPTTGETPAGVVRIADSRAISGARYTAATATTPGSLKVNIIDPVGLTVGDLATINCTISAGAAVTPASFSLDHFTAMDAGGASLSGIVPQFTVLTQ